MKTTPFLASLMAGILATTLAFTDVLASSQSAAAASATTEPAAEALYHTPPIALNGTTYTGEPGVLSSKSAIMSSGSNTRINYRLVPSWTGDGRATGVRVSIHMPSLTYVDGEYKITDRSLPATPLGVQGTLKAGGDWIVVSDTTVQGGPIVLQYDGDILAGDNYGFDIELNTYNDGTSGPYGGVPEGTVFEINGFVSYTMFNRVPGSEWSTEFGVDDDSRVTIVSTDLQWEPSIVPFVADGSSPVVPIWDRYQYADYIYTLQNTSTNPSSKINGYAVTFDFDTTDNINGIIPFDVNRFIYGEDGEPVPNADPGFREGKFIGVPGEGGVLIYDITDWDGESELTEELPYTYSGSGMIVLERPADSITPDETNRERQYLVSLPMSRQGFPSLPTTFKVRAVTDITLAENAHWTKTSIAERTVQLPTYNFAFSHTTKQPDVVYGYETWNQISDIRTASNVPIFDASMTYGVDPNFEVDRIEYTFDPADADRFRDATVEYSYTTEAGDARTGILRGVLDDEDNPTSITFDASVLADLDWGHSFVFTDLAEKLVPGESVPLTIRVYGTPYKVGTMTSPAVANYLERFASNEDYSQPTTYTDVPRSLQKNVSFTVIYPDEAIPSTRVRIDGTYDRKTVAYDAQSRLDFLFGIGEGTVAENSTTTITLNSASATGITDATLTLAGKLFEDGENVRVRVVAVDGTETVLNVEGLDGSTDAQFPLADDAARIIIDTDTFRSNGASAYASVTGKVANGTVVQHTVGVSMRTYQPVPYDKNTTRSSTGIIDIALPKELAVSSQIVGIYGDRRTTSTTYIPYEAPFSADYQLSTGGVTSPEFTYTLDLLEPSKKVGEATPTRVALTDAFLAAFSDLEITVNAVDGSVHTFTEGEIDLTTLPAVSSIVISGTQLSLASLTTVARVDYDSTLDMGETQQLRSRFSGTQNLPYTTVKTSTHTNTVEVRETKTTVVIEGVNQVGTAATASPTYSQWVEREWYCGYWDCGSKIDYTLDQGYKSLGGFVGTIKRPTTTYENNNQTTSVDVTFPTEHFDLYYIKVNSRVSPYVTSVDIYRTVDGVETLWKTVEGPLDAMNSVEGTYTRIATARPSTPDDQLFTTPADINDPAHPYYKDPWDADVDPSQPVSRVQVNLAFTRESANAIPQLSGNSTRAIEFMGRFYETSTGDKPTGIRSLDTFGIDRPITRSYTASPIYSLVAHPYALTRTGAVTNTNNPRQVVTMGTEGHYLASIWNVNEADWYYYNGHGPDIYSPVWTEFDEWLEHYDPEAFHDRLLYEFTYPANPGVDPTYNLTPSTITIEDTSTLTYLTALRIDYTTYATAGDGSGTPSIDPGGTDSVTLAIGDEMRAEMIANGAFVVTYDNALAPGFHRTGPGTYSVSLGEGGYATTFEAKFEEVTGFGDRTAEIAGVTPDSLGANLNEVDVRVGGIVAGNRDLVGTTRLYRHSDADVDADRAPTLMHTTSAILQGYTPKLGATIDMSFDATSLYDYTADGITPTTTTMYTGLTNTSQADITDFTMTITPDSAFRSRVLSIPAEAFDGNWTVGKVVIQQAQGTREVPLGEFAYDAATDAYVLDLVSLFPELLTETTNDVDFSHDVTLIERKLQNIQITFSAARDAEGAPLTRMWGSLSQGENLPTRITSKPYVGLTGVWVDETAAGKGWDSKPSFRNEEFKAETSSRHYSSFNVAVTNVVTPQVFTESAVSGTGNGGSKPSFTRNSGNNAPVVQHRLAQLQLHGLHLTEALTAATESGGYFYDADTDRQIIDDNIAVGDTTKVLYELRNSATETSGSLPVYEPRGHFTAPTGLKISDLQVITGTPDPRIASVIAAAGRTLVAPTANTVTVSGANPEKLQTVVFDDLWLDAGESVFVLVEYTAVNDYSADLLATQNKQVAPYSYARPGFLHQMQDYVVSSGGVNGAGADSNVAADYDADGTAEHLARVHPTYDYADPNRLRIGSEFDVESLSGTPMTLTISQIENEILHDNTEAVLYLTLDTRARGFELTELPQPAGPAGLADPTVEIEVDGSWVTYDPDVHELADVNRLRIDYGIVPARDGQTVLTMPAFTVHGIGHWQPYVSASAKTYDIISEARLVLTHHEGSTDGNPAVASYAQAPRATSVIHKAIPVIELDLKSFDDEAEALTPNTPSSALGKTSYRPGDAVSMKITARNANTAPTENTGYGKAPLLDPVIYDRIPEYIGTDLDRHMSGTTFDVEAAVAEGDLVIRHYDAAGALRTDVALPTATVDHVDALDVGGAQQFSNDRHNDSWGLLSSASPANTATNPADTITFRSITYTFPDDLGRGERLEIIYSGTIRDEDLPVATYPDGRSVYAPLSGWYTNDTPLAKNAHNYDMDMAALLHDAGITGSRGHEMTAAEFLSTSSSWVPGGTGERAQPVETYSRSYIDTYYDASADSARSHQVYLQERTDSLLFESKTGANQDDNWRFVTSARVDGSAKADRERVLWAQDSMQLSRAWLYAASEMAPDRERTETYGVSGANFYEHDGSLNHIDIPRRGYSPYAYDNYTYAVQLDELFTVSLHAANLGDHPIESGVEYLEVLPLGISPYAADGSLLGVTAYDGAGNEIALPEGSVKVVQKPGDPITWAAPAQSQEAGTDATATFTDEAPYVLRIQVPAALTGMFDAPAATTTSKYQRVDVRVRVAEESSHLVNGKAYWYDQLTVTSIDTEPYMELYASVVDGAGYGAFTRGFNSYNEKRHVNDAAPLGIDHDSLYWDFYNGDTWLSFEPYGMYIRGLNAQGTRAELNGKPAVMTGDQIAMRVPTLRVWNEITKDEASYTTAYDRSIQDYTVDLYEQFTVNATVENQQIESQDDYIRGRSGYNWYSGDYLNDEVWTRQPQVIGGARGSWFDPTITVALPYGIVPVIDGDIARYSEDLSGQQDVVFTAQITDVTYRSTTPAATASGVALTGGDVSQHLEVSVERVDSEHGLRYVLHFIAKDDAVSQQVMHEIRYNQSLTVSPRVMVVDSPSFGEDTSEKYYQPIVALAHTERPVSYPVVSGSHTTGSVPSGRDDYRDGSIGNGTTPFMNDKNRRDSMSSWSSNFGQIRVTERLITPTQKFTPATEVPLHTNGQWNVAASELLPDEVTAPSVNTGASGSTQLVLRQPNIVNQTKAGATAEATPKDRQLNPAQEPLHLDPAGKFWLSTEVRNRPVSKSNPYEEIQTAGDVHNSRFLVSAYVTSFAHKTGDVRLLIDGKLLDRAAFEDLGYTVEAVTEDEREGAGERQLIQWMVTTPDGGDGTEGKLASGDRFELRFELQLVDGFEGDATTGGTTWEHPSLIIDTYVSAVPDDLTLITGDQREDDFIVQPINVFGYEQLVVETDATPDYDADGEKTSRFAADPTEIEIIKPSAEVRVNTARPRLKYNSADPDVILTGDPYFKSSDDIEYLVTHVKNTGSALKDLVVEQILPTNRSNDPSVPLSQDALTTTLLYVTSGTWEFPQETLDRLTAAGKTIDEVFEVEVQVSKAISEDGYETDNWTSLGINSATENVRYDISGDRLGYTKVRVIVRSLDDNFLVPTGLRLAIDADPDTAGSQDVTQTDPKNDSIEEYPEGVTDNAISVGMRAASVGDRTVFIYDTAQVWANYVADARAKLAQSVSRSYLTMSRPVVNVKHEALYYRSDRTYPEERLYGWSDNTAIKPPAFLKFRGEAINADDTMWDTDPKSDESRTYAEDTLIDPVLTFELPSVMAMNKPFTYVPNDEVDETHPLDGHHRSPHPLVDEDAYQWTWKLVRADPTNEDSYLTHVDMYSGPWPGMDRNVITVWFDGMIYPGDKVVVDFIGLVDEYTPGVSSSDVTSRAYLTNNTGLLQPLNSVWNKDNRLGYVTDQNDLDRNNITSDRLVFNERQLFQYEVYDNFGKRKTAYSDLNLAGTVAPGLTPVREGGEYTFTISLDNTNEMEEKPYPYPIMYDVLPHVGDTSIFDAGASRESKASGLLDLSSFELRREGASPMVYPANKYTLYVGPFRKDGTKVVRSTLPEATEASTTAFYDSLATPSVASAVRSEHFVTLADFRTAVASDPTLLADARAILVMLNDAAEILPGKSKLTLTYDMTSPLNAPVYLEGSNQTATSADYAQWNSFVGTQRADSFKPQESNTAGVYVTEQAGTVSIGNYVWHDVNYNAAQDEGETWVDQNGRTLLKPSKDLNDDGTVDDPGINGVTVTLLTERGNYADARGRAITQHNGGWVVIDDILGDIVYDDLGQTTASDGPMTTTTRSDIHGNAGYYVFSNLAPATYRVMFEFPAAYDRYGVTTSEMFDKTAVEEFPKGSAADVPAPNATGSLVAVSKPADVTVSTPDELRMAFDLGVAEKIRTGGVIWNDKDRNGTRIAAEAKLAGYNVALIHPDGSPVLDHDGEPLTDVSDTDGAYEFTFLPRENEYLIQVTNAEGRYNVKIPVTPLLRSADPFEFSDDNDGVLVELEDGTLVVRSNPMDFGLEGLFASRFADRMNVDVGFYERDNFAVIGDRVWDDLNRNGIQDLGEPGVGGQTVHLYKYVQDEDGLWVRDETFDETATSDSHGFYSFRRVEAFDLAVADELIEYRYAVAVLPGELVAGYTLAPALQGTRTDLDSDFQLDGTMQTASDGTGLISLIADASGDEPVMRDVVTIDLGLIAHATASIAGEIFIDDQSDGTKLDDDLADPRFTATLEVRRDGGSWKAVGSMASTNVYSFEDLPTYDDASGTLLEYRVVVSEIPLWLGLTSHNAGADGIDSDFVEDARGATITAVSDVYVLAEHVDGHLIPVDTRTSISHPTVDLGLLEPASIIGGMVWDDADHDGLRAEDEKPIVGREVTLWELVDGEWVQALDLDGRGVVVSGEDGVYSFRVAPMHFDDTAANFLQPREYRVSAQRDGWQMWSPVNVGDDPLIDSDMTAPAEEFGTIHTGISGQFSIIEIEEGLAIPATQRDDTHMDMGLRSQKHTVIVGGSAWGEKLEDGLRQDGETPLAGLTVTLWELVDDEWVIVEDVTGTSTRTTDANGRYAFTVMPVDFDETHDTYLQPRTYRTTVDMPFGYRMSGGASVTATLNGSRVESIVADLVLFDEDGNVLLDELLDHRTLDFPFVQDRLAFTGLGGLTAALVIALLLGGGGLFLIMVRRRRDGREEFAE
ncbi:SdrD B-like domain-containing protein [Salinibacterium sp. ZJ70]|uniref:SdrD B-like domain-containing protein n=1 Tax=Salinibacterium sp. ZJ70 TaxID=2708084 RepID=UPI0014221EB5|nr:SdrD B-like domain-containing protein [Salinibacterium sp. ZJ70]